MKALADARMNISRSVATIEGKAGREEDTEKIKADGIFDTREEEVPYGGFETNSEGGLCSTANGNIDT